MKRSFGLAPKSKGFIFFESAPRDSPCSKSMETIFGLIGAISILEFLRMRARVRLLLETSRIEKLSPASVISPRR